MYFLTIKDPNYTIKGSRDPLGLQVVWQSAGRKVIPHISTVSNNIVDYQILSLAYSLKRILGMNEEAFPNFFILFEQLMAYTRFQKNKDAGLKSGFNGVEKVSKHYANANKEVRIGIDEREQILTRQRAYGIWGKYSRPFRDMNLMENQDLLDCYKDKLDKYPELIKIANRLVSKSEHKTPYRVSLAQMKEWETILNKPEGVEKEVFVDSILQDKFQGELLSIYHEMSEDKNNLDTITLLRLIRDKTERSDFKVELQQIIETEKTIGPLNRIFRYLQKKSFWKKEEIEENEFISKWRNEDIDTTGFSEQLRKMASLHYMSNIDLVKGLVVRNANISKNRHSHPWLSYEDKGLTVNHHQGEFFDANYDPAIHVDFNYFFDSYRSLYQQLYN